MTMGSEGIAKISKGEIVSSKRDPSLSKASVKPMVNMFRW